MPYIKQDERAYLDGPIREVILNLSDDPGQLNYVITRLITLWIAQFGGVRYRKIAEVSGVLINVLTSFDDRVVKPYEARKCAENGDAYQEIL